MLKRINLVLILIFLFLETVFAATITGKVSTKKVKVPKDFLIYIEKVEGKDFAPPSNPPRLDQKNLVFIPRVLPILKGTTVEFHNSDKARHNVLGVGAEDFDQGTWGQGIIKTRAFNKLGEVAILCNVHTEMEAFILVLQNPYFALADREGNYKIENVPQGTYKLKTWNDKLKPQEKEINIPAQGSVTADFEFK